MHVATPAWAFDAYQAIAVRLPRVPLGRVAPRFASTLEDIAEPFDVLFLDAYGVLNVGETAIPGVAERLAGLRRAGKRLMVVSNSAGYPKRAMLDRFARMGLSFTPDEVTSSREALLAAVAGEPPRHWGMMLSPAWGCEELEGLDVSFLADDPAEYNRAEGFLLIGSAGWTDVRQALLEAALRERPRPVLVGNPDLVAPREDGLSLEPGHFAHRLADATGVEPRFFGKPFPDVYRLALSRLAPPPRPERVLMVGDTLHTDVLGGRAMGFATALVTGYGPLAGADVAVAIERSGIVPDFVVERP